MIMIERVRPWTEVRIHPSIHDHDHRDDEQNIMQNSHNWRRGLYHCLLTWMAQNLVEKHQHHINVTSYQASHDHYLKVDHTHLLEIIKLSWKRSTQSCKLFHCPPPRHSQWQSTPPPVVALIWNFSTFLVRYMISHSFGFCYCLLYHFVSFHICTLTSRYVCIWNQPQQSK